MRHKSKLYCKDGDSSWGICLFGEMGNKRITVFSATAAIGSQMWTNICNWQRILQSATAPASMIILSFEGSASIAITWLRQSMTGEGRGIEGQQIWSSLLLSVFVAIVLNYTAITLIKITQVIRKQSTRFPSPPLGLVHTPSYCILPHAYPRLPLTVVNSIVSSFHVSIVLYPLG